MKKIIIGGVLSSAILAGQAEAANCVFGCPVGNSDDIINRPIYSLQNNSETKFADWVAYQVTDQTINGPSRSRSWKADPSLAANVTLEPKDYTGAYNSIGTDRGHQVPLASFSNTSHWAMTNYLSNITPQKSDLNRGPWKNLEAAVRNIAGTGQNVFVVTGPLYERPFAVLPGADEDHTVPSGYFKVVITKNADDVAASAFIFEQETARGADFCNFETTVDVVESRSGFNIMPNLSEAQQTTVEEAIGGLASSLGC